MLLTASDDSLCDKSLLLVVDGARTRTSAKIPHLQVHMAGRLAIVARFLCLQRYLFLPEAIELYEAIRPFLGISI